MILTDIYIPSMDQSFDFQVDETVPVNSLIIEIAEMIGNEVKSGKQYRAEEFLLCSMDQGVILKKTETLASSGIKNGSRLMLV
ncbi:MAG: EsaB/YukD family protein [Lachnospiraceae bacterium]|nr:EsaB/YukD family protein [Lachnospiraceae bacterium]